MYEGFTFWKKYLTAKNRDLQSGLGDEVNLNLKGWFAVAYLNELKPGAVLRRKMFGKELVVFATDEGYGVADGYCPHLGSLLSEYGRVEDNCLVCPFHSFKFDRHGDCTSSYKGKIKPKFKLNMYPNDVRHGVLLAWFGGGEPQWHILDDSPPQGYKWSKPVSMYFEDVALAPKELHENVTDHGHFSSVHLYHSIEQIEEPQFEFPVASSKFRATRPRRLLWLEEMKMEILVQVNGMGYSRASIFQKGIGHLRIVVMPIPIMVGRTDARVIVQVAMPERVPQTILNAVAYPAAFEVWKDFWQDILIWRNKIHLHKPRLVDGDGPIAKYRKWAKKFENDLTVVS